MIDKYRENNINDKLKALNDLLRQKQELSDYLVELIAIYKLDPALFTPEIWFDLVNLPKNAKPLDDSMLGILDLRAKFRKEHNYEVEKLKDLNQEIFLNNIDLALEKIKNFQDKLDDK